MESIKIKGVIDCVIRGIDGKIRDHFVVNNTITSAGKAQLALLAGDASAVPFTFLALGLSSTAPAVGQTALVSEITDTGLERKAATVSRVTTTVTNDTLNLYASWTATGNITVEEIGIFNDATTGTMLGRALTSARVLVSGEKIEPTYEIIFG